MGYREKNKINDLLVHMPDNQRLFRINAGLAWTGNINRLPNGSILISNPRPFHGAPDGWPDLAGWETIEIKPDMVGKKIAVFKGIEVKTGTSKLNNNQQQFSSLLLLMGGKFEIERD